MQSGEHNRTTLESAPVITNVPPVQGARPIAPYVFLE